MMRTKLYLWSFERLWILCRINGIETAVGVVYFPNDGVDTNKTDLLFYELLEKNLLENRYFVKIIRVITVLDFYSSVKLLNWILLTHLTVATASILEYSMIKDQL